VTSAINRIAMTTPTAEAPATKLAAGDGSPAPAERYAPSSIPSGAGKRFLERFALIAFALYHVPLFLNNYPSLGGGGFNDTGLAVRWGHVFTAPGIWVARHAFHLTGPMSTARNGDNGDVGEEFARLLLAVVIGLVGAAIWTAKDRRQPRAAWVPETTRVLLRYSIALGLISYGVAKLLPMQFPALSPAILDQRVGELRPMSLLWTFMQYSRPYAFVGGLMEIVAALLLCFRRTATLGAVVCLAVMANVLLLNYAYDVPVKLYATMIVVSAAALLVYEFPRLSAFFLTNRPAPPADDSFIHRRVGPGVRWTIKTLAVGSVIVSSFAAMLPAIAQRTTALSATGPNGTWAVTSFRLNEQPTDSIPQGARWMRLVVSPANVIIRFDSDSLIGCGRQAAGTYAMALSCGRNRGGVVRWLRDGNVLWLEGTFDGATLRASSRYVAPDDYRLMRGGFHWITDP
jgi:hypothetical protein